MKHLDIRAFQAEFFDIRLSFGLVIDTLSLQAAQTRADLNPFRLAATEPGEVRVTVSALNIATFLESKAPGGLRKFTVRIENDFLYVEAVAKIVVDVKVKITCKLVIVEGNRVDVQLESVDLLGGPAKKIVENLIGKVNPIFEVSDLPLPAKLQSISCDNGLVIVIGAIWP